MTVVTDRFVPDFCAQAVQIARAAGGSIPGPDSIGKVIAAGHWMTRAQRDIEALVQALAAEWKLEPCEVRRRFNLDPP